MTALGKGEGLQGLQESLSLLYETAPVAGGRLGMHILRLLGIAEDLPDSARLANIFESLLADPKTILGQCDLISESQFYNYEYMGRNMKLKWI